MSRTRGLILGLAGLLILGVLASQITGSGFAGSRGFSYGFAAPKGWVIHHRTTFNGVTITPGQIDVIGWIGDNGMSGSGTVAGSIPQPMMDRDLVEITSEWSEWKTGKAFRATLKVQLAQDAGNTTIRFERDGALSVYVRSGQFLAGGLGRPATYWDHDERARTCGTRLSDAKAAELGLTAARDNNFAIPFDNNDPRDLPDAPFSTCSEQ